MDIPAELQAVGQYGSAAFMGIGVLLWGASKLKTLWAADSAVAAGANSQTELLRAMQEERKQLINERDEERRRADAFAKERNDALAAVAGLQAEVAGLKKDIDMMREEAIEGQEKLDALMALLQHLIFNKPIPAELQMKLHLIQALGEPPEEKAHVGH